MTELVELVRLIADRGRWLVTVAIVAAIVFLMFQFSHISIDTPYVYVVYVIYLAGITCAVFLVTGMIVWVWQRISDNLQSMKEARDADKRALSNLKDIGYEHAEALCWIVNNSGERFSIEPSRMHYQLVEHGFLVFDDEATRGNSSTYLRVRKVVWDKVTASHYRWPYRVNAKGDYPPWTHRIM